MPKFDKFVKTSDESVSNFINRVCSAKNDLDATWKDISIFLNEELNLNYSESWYAKNYRDGKFDFIDNISGESTTAEWTKLNTILAKKVEVSDLVAQNNAYIRRLSREQTIVDIAHDYAEIMNKQKILDTPTLPLFFGNNAKEGILLLSDWHYGMVCDNPWNTFNPEVCRNRVNELLQKVINIVVTNEIDRVHILDLADLIAGRIHLQIRVESRFDVITQTMDVCEILAEFINELSQVCYVDFYSCLDNHSRLEPNKKESLDLESLARIIPWYLLERLKKNDNVVIHSNVYGPDIITCTVAGHKIIGVHGDNDAPKTALDKLSLLTHEHYEMLCAAHLHHFSMDEEHESIVVGNASLMGVDSYSAKLRLSSKPSQTFIIATPENVCECVYRLTLH